MIVAHEEKASSNLFNMSKLYYEELPDTIRPMRRFNNGKNLSFENSTNDESEKQKNPGFYVATLQLQQQEQAKSVVLLHHPIFIFQN